MARSRARALLNCSSQGQRRGRCRVNRLAERVIRPAKAKTRRLRVLRWSRSADPGKCGLIQRARLCAITCTAIQAPLAAKRPEGRLVQPHVVLEVAYHILDLGVTAMIGLQFQRLPGDGSYDEAVIAVGGQELLR